MHQAFVVDVERLIDAAFVTGFIGDVQESEIKSNGRGFQIAFEVEEGAYLPKVIQLHDLNLGLEETSMMPRRCT